MKNYKSIKTIQIGKFLFIIGKMMTDDEFRQWQANQQQMTASEQQ